MKNKILINDIRHNVLETFATWFFLSVSVFSFGLTCLLFVSLLGSIDSLTNKAKTPDFLQMHAGDIDEAQISKFVSDRDDVSDYQIINFSVLTVSLKLCLLQQKETKIANLIFMIWIFSILILSFLLLINIPFAFIILPTRRGGRVVEGGGLENR